MTNHRSDSAILIQDQHPKQEAFTETIADDIEGNELQLSKYNQSYHEFWTRLNAKGNRDLFSEDSLW